MFAPGFRYIFVFQAFKTTNQANPGVTGKNDFINKAAFGSEKGAREALLIGRFTGSDGIGFIFVLSIQDFDSTFLHP